MRFGHQLKTSLIRDHEFSYIAYDDLKASLKTDLATKPSKTNKNPERRPWTEDDEQRFIIQLEQELDKVFTFQHVKSQDISRRIRSTESEVNDVLRRASPAHVSGQHQALAVTSDADLPDEDEFILLEEDLSDIIADVHDLVKFTRLNYTGFQKIIKKHDKNTSWHLRPVFATRLSAKPFWKDNYDAQIIKLSRLYDLVRTRGNPVKGDSAAGGGQQNFVRNTTKYWVHPDNITELKLIILKHLPVLVFNASKEFELKDSAISSIYYDNTDSWELYEGRLKKTEGAEAIRLRWYGGMESDKIFVERKTHREDWTGESSVKARFELKEKHVNDFMAGRLTVGKAFEKMRKDGKKKEEEIKNLEQLAREVQYRVITRKLVPVTRSFYNRTAFQLPGDARVRISLDTELTMTREDNLDGKKRSGDNWRRTDIGIDWPFSQLPDEDVERFPYAVLEVKLQTQQGQEPPQWIRDLTASHLVEAVPKFSKFIHGTVSLMPKMISLLPYWIPQMDVDIRKPVTHHFGIEHPGQSNSNSTNLDDDYSDDDDMDDDDDADDLRAPATNGQDNDNENLQRLREARDLMEQHDLDRRQDISGGNSLDVEERINADGTYDDDYPLYDSDDEEDLTPEEALAAAKRRGPWAYRSQLILTHLSKAANRIISLVSGAVPAPSATPIPRGDPSSTLGVPTVTTAEVNRKLFTAPPGKRIHVPVRVEPKVYFAAERTFLAWLEFSIIIGGIAATLLNFGDWASFASAWAFTVLACCALLYSMVLYLWRVKMIRNRRAVTYHDKYGPTLLCIGLLAAVTVSFGYRLAKGGSGGLKGGLKG